jgi:hypothetical protein
MSDTKMSDIKFMDMRAKEAHAATAKWVLEIVTIYAKYMSTEDHDLFIKESMKAARFLAERAIKDIEDKL